MITKCICCCTDDVVCVGTLPSVIYFAGRVLNHPLAGGELYRCRLCGVMFRYPFMEKNALDELYRLGKNDNWQEVLGERKDWQIARGWITGSLKQDSAILDVGCFDGGFLNTIEATYSRFGIEIHEAAGVRAQQYGIQIIGKNYEDMANHGASYDAVLSFDVIEHTQNPLEFLKQIVSITNDKGVIIISTGNCDALSWRILGSRYWYCAIGEHLTFINPNWCEWAGKQLGLKVKKTIKFSHTYFSFKHFVSDIAKNLFYAATPNWFEFLRKVGMGRDELREHKNMLAYPPNWMSAKDHFICIFEKNVQQ